MTQEQQHRSGVQASGRRPLLFEVLSTPNVQSAQIRNKSSAVAEMTAQRCTTKIVKRWGESVGGN